MEVLFLYFRQNFQSPIFLLLLILIVYIDAKGRLILRQRRIAR